MKNKCNCIEILRAVADHSRGKCTSRYTLAIERSIEALEAGSPRKAMRLWDTWFDKTAQEIKKINTKKK